LLTKVADFLVDAYELTAVDTTSAFSALQRRDFYERLFASAEKHRPKASSCGYIKGVLQDEMNGFYQHRVYERSESPVQIDA
jgi:hypothetical protein